MSEGTYGLVNTALKLAFVSTWVGIWIDWIKTLLHFAVSCLSKCTVGAVATINGIEKVCDN